MFSELREQCIKLKIMPKFKDEVDVMDKQINISNLPDEFVKIYK